LKKAVNYLEVLAFRDQWKTTLVGKPLSQGTQVPRKSTTTGTPGTVKCTVRGNQGTVKFTIPRRPGNVSQGKRKANTQANPFSFHSTEFSSRAGD